jgi:nitroimidazol reductase NimA-like FMN-containing flavoprotein (pyridoxamine 5'-phosphate oxidase superfamily)
MVLKIRLPVEEAAMGHVEQFTGLEVLTPGDCLYLLAGGCIGRVGFGVSGQTHVLPVNYAVDKDGSVVFRTMAQSILTSVAAKPVAFEVDGFDERHQMGWSVCVHGVGREITDADDPTAGRLRELSVVTWAPGQRDRWFAITPDEITGRRLPLAATAADFGWTSGVVS